MDQAQAVGAPQGRPVLITIMCVLGFIGLPFVAWMIVSGMASQISPTYPVLLGVSSLIGAACMVGLWLMRKWAVYVYTGFAVINQVILAAMSLWNPLALILPGIFIVIMFIYLPRMR
jgi:hypothetical protein